MGLLVEVLCDVRHMGVVLKEGCFEGVTCLGTVWCEDALSLEGNGRGKSMVYSRARARARVRSILDFYY